MMADNPPPDMSIKLVGLIVILVVGLVWGSFRQVKSYARHHTTSFPNEGCRRVLVTEKSASIEMIESRMRRSQGEPAGGE